MQKATEELQMKNAKQNEIREFVIGRIGQSNKGKWSNILIK